MLVYHYDFNLDTEKPLTYEHQKSKHYPKKWLQRQ